MTTELRRTSLKYLCGPPFASCERRNFDGANAESSKMHKSRLVGCKEMVKRELRRHRKMTAQQIQSRDQNTRNALQAWILRQRTSSPFVDKEQSMLAGVVVPPTCLARRGSQELSEVLATATYTALGIPFRSKEIL